LFYSFWAVLFTRKKIFKPVFSHFGLKIIFCNAFQGCLAVLLFGCFGCPRPTPRSGKREPSESEAERLRSG
jgi:hypothetical protein